MESKDEDPPGEPPSLAADPAPRATGVARSRLKAFAVWCAETAVTVVLTIFFFLLFSVIRLQLGW